MTFLAGLELSRRRLLFLRQAKPFAELWMYRREEDGGGEAEPIVDQELVEKGAEA
jgi:chromatin segregation and condensation protein Rec8/ScpA/Scc1 (kleisin family)